MVIVDTMNIYVSVVLWVYRLLSLLIHIKNDDDKKNYSRRTAMILVDLVRMSQGILTIIIAKY